MNKATKRRNITLLHYHHLLNQMGRFYFALSHVLLLFLHFYFVRIQFKKKEKNSSSSVVNETKNMQLWQQFCNGAKHKVHICWCYAKWISHSCVYYNMVIRLRVLCLHFCDNIISSKCFCCNERTKKKINYLMSSKCS